VIDAEAQDGSAAMSRRPAEGRLRKELKVPATGHLRRPRGDSRPLDQAMEREIFGPVLHVATFRAARSTM
jgi:RHH-type proline utilization regulon transcriptional repressor/proline dehydrogenase/delta 1-pyrroline-5-carboxylate dehydrogenase